MFNIPINERSSKRFDSDSTTSAKKIVSPLGRKEGQIYCIDPSTFKDSDLHGFKTKQILNKWVKIGVIYQTSPFLKNLAIRDFERDSYQMNLNFYDKELSARDSTIILIMHIGYWLCVHHDFYLTFKDKEENEILRYIKACGIPDVREAFYRFKHWHKAAERVRKSFSKEFSDYFQVATSLIKVEDVGLFIHKLKANEKGGKDDL